MRTLVKNASGHVGYDQKGRMRFQVNKVTQRLYQIRVDEYDAGGFRCGVPRFFRSTNQRFTHMKYFELAEGLDFSDTALAEKVVEIAPKKARRDLPLPPATNHSERDEIGH